MISVIIPVYNRAIELKRAINSVLNQTIQDFEILVVDDCSDIDLKTLCDQFNDTRIHYFRLNEKGNANVCRNMGISKASGEYIAMLDSDDEWMPHHLQNKLDYITKHHIDGVFGSFVLDTGIATFDQISRPFHKKEKMVNYILSDGLAQTSTYFFKATCAKKVKWDESLKRHQDWDFIVRFSKEFTLKPCYDITCRVHWKAGERRAEHFDSVIQFIQQNRNDIDKKYYFDYHAFYYKAFVPRTDVVEKYKRHYKKEMLRYFDVISYNDFMSLFGKNKNAPARLFLRMEFIFRVLFL